MDLAGNIKFQTIAVTGIDPLFITALLIYVASLALFFWVAKKPLLLASKRKRTTKLSFDLSY